MISLVQNLMKEIYFIYFIIIKIITIVIKLLYLSSTFLWEKYLSHKSSLTRGCQENKDGKTNWVLKKSGEVDMH